MTTDNTQVTEDTLKAFSKLTIEQLQTACQKLSIDSDGREQQDLITDLIAGGYDPLKPVMNLLPVIFLNVKSCEEVNTVNTLMKAKAFSRMRLPLVDRWQRVQKGFWHSTMPCEPATAKKLIKNGTVKVGFHKLQATMDAIAEKPEDYTFTWCLKKGKDTRTGNSRPYVTLHAQHNAFDLDTELEKTKVQSV